MKVAEICSRLESEFNCRHLSGIAPAPSDIDIYVPPDSIDAVRRFVGTEGFVCSSNDDGQYVYRRFEEGSLYIIDLLWNFNAYTRYLTTLALSEEGGRRIGDSQSLHKSFKYLCCGSPEKVRFIGAHQEELATFFEEPSNFTWISPRLIAAARGPVEDLVKTARFSFQWRSLLTTYICTRLFVPLHRRWQRIGKGCTVAFVGPDGSGKSFFIEKFRYAGPTRIVYMGDWFFVLQKIYNFLLQIPSPYNRFVYILYPIENYARLLKVLMHRFLGRVVLVDRFPGTNRNVIHEGVLGSLNRLTFTVFPKPDFMILLYAPPEVVYERKQELSVQEIGQMQRKLSLMLERSRSRFLVLDTRDLDESLNTLLAKIYGASGISVAQ